VKGAQTTVERTCDQCYFRRAELCALPGNTPCPTFRAVRRGAIESPRQARLIARPPLPANAAA
jgi:hypothetical protein